MSKEDAQWSHDWRTEAELSAAEHPNASIVEAHEGGLSSREQEEPVPPGTLLDEVTDCEGGVSEARPSSEEPQEADDLGTASERPLRQVAVASSSARSLPAVDSEREGICDLSARGVANRLVLRNPNREYSVMFLALVARFAWERLNMWARKDEVPEARHLLDMLATELKEARTRSSSRESEDGVQEEEDLDWRTRLVGAEDA